MPVMSYHNPTKHRAQPSCQRLSPCSAGRCHTTPQPPPSTALSRHVSSCHQGVTVEAPRETRRDVSSPYGTDKPRDRQADAGREVKTGNAVYRDGCMTNVITASTSRERAARSRPKEQVTWCTTAPSAASYLGAFDASVSVTGVTLRHSPRTNTGSHNASTAVMPADDLYTNIDMQCRKPLIYCYVTAGIYWTVKTGLDTRWEDTMTALPNKLCSAHHKITENT